MTALVKAYHVKDGETSMFPIDAAAAIANHPKEWSDKPWPASAKKARAKDAEAVAVDAGAGEGGNPPVEGDQVTS
jgi:hypothetical protein